MATKSRFIILRHDKVDQADEVIIDSEGLTIGRLIGNDLALNHRAVSRTHAGIKDLAGEYWLFNLSKANGTMVNGQLVDRVPLADGDVIQIGPYLLKVSDSQAGLGLSVEMALDVNPMEGRTQQLQLPGAGGAGVDTEGTLIMQIPGLGSARVGSSKLGATGLLTGLLPALDEKALNIFWEKRKREAGKMGDETPLHPKGGKKVGKAQFNWTPTLDLRKPWRKAYFSWAVIIVSLLSIAAVFVSHDRVYAPGETSAAHSKSSGTLQAFALRYNGNSCSSCHGVVGDINNRCTECHTTTGFKPVIYAGHEREKVTCTACHSEHQGPDSSSGLIAYGLCASCHNDTYRTKTDDPAPGGKKAGSILGVPHGGTVGYPKENGQWTWKGLTVAQWRSRGVANPEDAAKGDANQQFHLTHINSKMQRKYRIDCKDCHTAGSSGNGATDPAWLSSPRAECAKCHAVSYNVEGTKAASINCSTCHEQHGNTSRDLASITSISVKDVTRVKDLIAAVPTAAPDNDPVPASALGGAGVFRQDKNLIVLGTDNNVAGLPWYAWLIVLGILPVGGLVVAIRDTARTRSFFRNAKPAPKKEETAGLPGSSRSIDLEKAKEEGPAFPHPVIDPVLCIGCHACVEACPHDVLAIVNGISTPTALDQCMEDTSCQVECPTSPKACVVINTNKVIPKRKVPERDTRFKTNVDGIYLVGDVSGVPLIKNAINEGAQVVDAIEDDLKKEGRDPNAQYDVGIIGIGPAGLSTTAIAKQRGMTYVALEQDRVVSTIQAYPAGKYIFFKPDTVNAKGLVPLPGVGEHREPLLKSWMDSIQQNGLDIHEGEMCVGIKGQNGCFTISTKIDKKGGDAGGAAAATYTVRKIVLAIGNRGTPMELKVPGEKLKIMHQPPARITKSCTSCGRDRTGPQAFCPKCGCAFNDAPPPAGMDDKTKYKLSDPDDFVSKKCIVVGAGNSAIECAVDLCGLKREEDGSINFIRSNDVTLVIRSDFKGDLKLGNKMNVYDCIDAGKIKVFFGTAIKEIKEDQVTLMNARSKEEKATIPNDFVFALIGGERPTKFLEALGIKIG